VIASLSPRALAAAARFEADRRAKRYPDLILNGLKDADEATTDWQAWLAIADWLETGRSQLLGMPAGVATPPNRAIDWDLLAERATIGARQVVDMLANDRAFAAAPEAQRQPDVKPKTPAQLDALDRRAALLTAIATRVDRQREILRLLNAELRAQAEQRKAA
jgi:hypothetical protein